MKQVNLVAALLLFSFSALAQTVTPDPGPYAPMNQKYEYRWIKTSGGLWNLGKLIVQDSTDLRSITYVTTAPDNDSSKRVASTAWVKKNITASSGSGGIDSVRRRGVTDTIQEFYGGALGFRRFAFTAPLPENVVPYTGATQDVNLGEFGLQTGNVEFDNTPTNLPTSVGSMYYNDNDGTLDLILKGGNVTLQIGQETVLRVVNKTATNVNLLQANYQAVRVTGAQGQRVKVDLAQATSDTFSAETIGLVTETINNNQEGFITTSGLVRNINTTGSLQGETWADGDIIYLSPTTAGSLTKVKPIAPNHLVIIGYVIHAHITQGSIFVKVDNGYELDELHNVKITTPSNNQALVFNDTTDVWENKSLVTVTSYGKNATRDSTILLLSNGTRYAAKDSVGSGGGSGIVASPLYISTNTLTTNSVEVKKGDGVNSDRAIGINDASFKNIGLTGDITLQNSFTSGGIKFAPGNYHGLVALTSLDSNGRVTILTDTSTSNFKALQIFTPGLTNNTKNQIVLGKSLVSGFNWVFNEHTTPSLSYLSLQGNSYNPGANSFTATQNGFFGFGTTTPISTLTVVGDQTNTGGNFSVTGTTTLTGATTAVGAFTVNNNTGNPVATFNNSGAGNMNIRLNSGSNTLTSVLYQNAGANVWYVGNTGTSGTNTYRLLNSDVNGNVERFTLLQSGRMGLSTTAPTAMLHLPAGTATASTAPLKLTAGTKLTTPEAGAIEYVTGKFVVQNDGITFGATAGNASAKLEVQSTTQGVLFPRMTTTQKNAIASPAAGLVVYDTTLNKLCVYTTTWETITSL